MNKLLFILAVTIFVSSTAFPQKGNTWVKKNYSVSGSWSVKVENGRSYLVLQSDFATKKGPDLKLFLTEKTASSIGKNEAVEKHGIFLGDLKSNKGKQKFLLPSGISMADFKSLVIHCEEYTKVWGAAPL